MPLPTSSMVLMMVSVGTTRASDVPNSDAFSSGTVNGVELVILEAKSLPHSTPSATLNQRDHPRSQFLRVDHGHAFGIVVEVCKHVTSCTPLLSEHAGPVVDALPIVAAEVPATRPVEGDVDKCRVDWLEHGRPRLVMKAHHCTVRPQHRLRLFDVPRWMTELEDMPQRVIGGRSVDFSHSARQQRQKVVEAVEVAVKVCRQL